MIAHKNRTIGLKTLTSGLKGLVDTPDKNDKARKIARLGLWVRAHSCRVMLAVLTRSNAGHDRLAFQKGVRLMRRQAVGQGQGGID